MSATQSKCSEQSDGRSSEGRGFMLFGVRLMMEEGSFRKSASMTNLAQYDHQPQDSNNDAAGYASDDVVHPSGRSRERKRGVPWSEEEHRLFLLGLQRVGKGDWRGISRNYVKTRTPTQVASHAQKYFLRRNNHNRRRRRSSLFDITTDTVATPANEDQMHQESPPQPPIVPRQNLTRNPVPTFPVAVTPLSLPIPTENPMEEDLALGQLNRLTNSPRPIRPIPILPIPPPPSSKMAKLNLNHNTTTLEPPSLSLNLSVSSLSQSPPPSEELPSSNEHSPREHHPPPPFQAMPASFSGSGGDSIISVA